MIYEGAFHEAAYPPGQRPSFREALADPRAARFVEGWGRPGDFGVLAVEDGRPVGAAWCRLFGEDDPGWTIDDETPDLAIGVVAGRRGSGWGGRLLAELLVAARREGFEAVSLSVAKWHRQAVSLYERYGFVTVEESGDTLLMRASVPRTAR
jgi:ribosomal protein S18 acetylase RimI-like enzyme